MTTELQLKYCTYDKALAPRPIRMQAPGWGGSDEKMVDGSEPQPWHCLPFTEGATQGLELLYQYDTECHVINEGGDVRFDWDFANEPGGSLTGGEFVTFFPKKGTKYYLFNTSLDLQAPPGYVVCTHPHPRFFTDETGTAPLALIGHVQSEWWPKKFFVVFRAPAPGQRHIFRKGEPYVQIRLAPQRVKYELAPMTADEEARRRAMERDVLTSAADIATNVWRNPSGYRFNNHYKVLASAFARQGVEGVENILGQATERQRLLVSEDKSIAECMALGLERFGERDFAEAKSIFVHVLNRDNSNAEAVNRLGVIAACEGMPLLALKLMGQAVALQPQSPLYHSDLGELFRRMGRLQEAETSLRNSLKLKADDPQVLSNLGLTLAQQGRRAEGIELLRRALTVGPNSPNAHLRMGLVLAQERDYGGARGFYEAAIKLDPNSQEAREALRDIPTA